jgi:EAL and modified HD-GYP domain-containing signal transduction protein
MDTLLHTPMSEVVVQLNLTDDVRDALLSRQGRLGRLLAIIEAIEQNDHDAVAAALEGGKPCTLAELPAMQVAAMTWGNGIATPGTGLAD